MTSPVKITFGGFSGESFPKDEAIISYSSSNFFLLFLTPFHLETFHLFSGSGSIESTKADPIVPWVNEACFEMFQERKKKKEN